jgi:hypothetical protein
MGQRGRDQADQRGDGGLSVVSRARCGILHAAPQSRGRYERRCLVRSRFCEAARRALHRARDTRPTIQISNSQTFSFSRRKASEVCQSLANRARRWSGGRRQDACEAPMEAGLIDPPRAARHRARPRLGAAPPSAPPATRPSTVPGPRSSQLSLCPPKDRF